MIALLYSLVAIRAATSYDFSKSVSDDGNGTAATGGSFTGEVGGGVAGAGDATAVGDGAGFFSVVFGVDGGGAVIDGNGGAADDEVADDFLDVAKTIQLHSLFILRPGEE